MLKIDTEFTLSSQNLLDLAFLTESTGLPAGWTGSSTVLGRIYILRYFTLIFKFCLTISGCSYDCKNTVLEVGQG